MGKRFFSPPNMKGDIWFVSDFFFLLILFFTSLVLLLSMSLARIVVGNFIDFTVHASFLEFSLNNENALLSGTEIKLNPDDPALKRVLSDAAFQWDGNSDWDKNVYVDGKLYDVGESSKNIFDQLISGPYLLELRKDFDSGDGRTPVSKRIIIAERTQDKILSDPEIAEVGFYLPYYTCSACSNQAVYRLYSTIK